MGQGVGSAVCVRCGGPIEAGDVTGSGGYLGLAKYGTLGWLAHSDSRWRRFSYGIDLVRKWFGPAQAPGYRCRSCRLVWFEY